MIVPSIAYLIHTALPYMGDEDNWGLLFGWHIGWIIPLSIIVSPAWFILRLNVWEAIGAIIGLRILCSVACWLIVTSYRALNKEEAK